MRSVMSARPASGTRSRSLPRTSLFPCRVRGALAVGWVSLFADSVDPPPAWAACYSCAPKTECRKSVRILLFFVLAIGGERHAQIPPIWWDPGGTWPLLSRGPCRGCPSLHIRGHTKESEQPILRPGSARLSAGRAGVSRTGYLSLRWPQRARRRRAANRDH